MGANATTGRTGQDAEKTSLHKLRAIRLRSSTCTAGEIIPAV